VALAVSRTASNPEGGLETGIVCCKICGGQSGRETGFFRVLQFYLVIVITLMLHTHTHTHTHTLSREKPSRRSAGTFKQSHSFDVGEHWTESTSTLFSYTLTIPCSLDSPSADCSRFRFVEVDAVWSRSFLCWVQNSVDVHITACICVIHLELHFLLAVLFVCYCVLSCDLSVSLNLP
jgi:hypothetical protein